MQLRLRYFISAVETLSSYGWGSVIGGKRTETTVVPFMSVSPSLLLVREPQARCP